MSGKENTSNYRLQKRRPLFAFNACGVKVIETRKSQEKFQILGF